MNNFKLTDFISVQKGVIPKDVCEQIIKDTENITWSKHRWYNPEEDKSTSFEDKELDVLFPPGNISQLVFKYVTEQFGKYGDLCKPLSADTDYSHTISQCCGIRLNRYNTNTLMRSHFDHIHSLFDGQQKGVPVLSMIGVLNEDYTGGELTFFDDYTVPTNTGDVIVFPSCFLYPHRIKEVTSGTRYSFVSWAW
jgi:hypothetical protein